MVEALNNTNLSYKKKKLSDKVKTSIATAKGVVGTIKKTTDCLGISMNANSSNGKTELSVKNDNAIQLLIELLTLVGVSKEDMVNFLTKYLTYLMPALEVGVKTLLLTNLKGMISCSYDPRIPENLRKYNPRGENATETNRRGIDIGVESIDLIGKLSKSPFGDGKNLYFGINPEATTNAYQLARANDFDAFLWFVIHKAKFPSPSIVNDENLDTWFKSRYKENLTLNNTIDPIKIGYRDTKNNINTGVTSLFQDIVIDYPEPLSVTGQTTCIMPGNTFVQKKNGKYGSVISLCVTAEESVKYTTDVNNITSTNPEESQKLGTKYISRSEIVPVSDDWTSANWYVNPKRYFYQNLGLDAFSGKKKLTDSRNYAQEKPICNLQFFDQSSSVGQINGIVDNQIRLTILPRPLLHVPEKGEPIWRFQRILFNEKGEPDKDGKYSIHPGKFEKIKKEVTEITKIKSAEKYEKITNGLRTSTPVVAYNWIEVTNGTPYPTTVEIFSAGNSQNESLVKKLNIKAFHNKYYKLDKDSKYDIYFVISPSPVNGDKKNTKVPNISDGKLFIKTIKVDSDSIKQNSTVEYCLDRNPQKIGISINKSTGAYKVINTKNPNQDILPYLQEVYKGLTIYEFNYDWVMGMKIFDAKNIITNLLESTLGAKFGGSVKLSFEKKLELEKITQVIKEIIESDDTELKDCYYSFSNDTYDAMLQRSEEAYHNHASFRDNQIKYGDFTEVKELIDKFDNNATLHEQRDLLKRIITKATVTISESEKPVNRPKIEFNFVNNLIENLITSLVNSLLTPKVLMVIMVNKKIMGSDIGLISFQDIINSMRSLIVAIVKEVKDAILQELLKLLLEKLSPIVKLMEDMLLQETLGYYRDLMMQIMKECSFSLNLPWFKNQFEDTSTGNVDYADIDKSETINEQPTTNNC